MDNAGEFSSAARNPQSVRAGNSRAGGHPLIESPKEFRPERMGRDLSAVGAPAWTGRTRRTTNSSPDTGLAVPGPAPSDREQRPLHVQPPAELPQVQDGPVGGGAV